VAHAFVDQFIAGYAKPPTIIIASSPTTCVCFSPALSKRYTKNHK
jgi:hypothetical protein